MRVVFFGTYDASAHPRVAVLQEGLRAHGHEVRECNVPLGLDTAARVRILRRPWLLPRLAASFAAAWWRLWRESRRLDPPAAVVVGYLGHFDVHLARRLWPRAPLVLDHLAPARETAVDRGAEGSLLGRALGGLDRRALAAADLRVVDTAAHLDLVPPTLRAGAVVVPVGASGRWFHEPRRRPDASVRVVFFGLFTPLQGTPTIARAIALLADEGRIRFTLIGSGQDYEPARRLGGASPHARWLAWVPAERLPELVAEHDVCLGIFGTGPKARRVVPTKAYQGAAAGCAVVTADTPPQREALGEAAALIPAGDPEALAGALLSLADDSGELWNRRRRAHRRAREAFTPTRVVEPLVAELRGGSGPEAIAADRPRT